MQAKRMVVLSPCHSAMGLNIWALRVRDPTRISLACGKTETDVVLMHSVVFNINTANNIN